MPAGYSRSAAPKRPKSHRMLSAKKCNLPVANEGRERGGRQDGGASRDNASRSSAMFAKRLSTLREPEVAEQRAEPSRCCGSDPGSESGNRSADFERSCTTGRARARPHARGRYSTAHEPPHLAKARSHATNHFRAGGYAHTLLRPVRIRLKIHHIMKPKPGESLPPRPG